MSVEQIMIALLHFSGRREADILYPVLDNSYLNLSNKIKPDQCVTYLWKVTCFFKSFHLTM